MGIVQDSLEVVKLAAKFANPELIERVTALNEQVLALSSKNVEFQQEVFRVTTELRETKEKLSLIGNVERREGFIYLKTESEPCCARCLDVDRILVRVIPLNWTQSMCPQCKTIFAGVPIGLTVPI